MCGFPSKKEEEVYVWIVAFSLQVQIQMYNLHYGAAAALLPRLVGVPVAVGVGEEAGRLRRRRRVAPRVVVGHGRRRRRLRLNPQLHGRYRRRQPHCHRRTDGRRPRTSGTRRPCGLRWCTCARRLPAPQSHSRGALHGFLRRRRGLRQCRPGAVLRHVCSASCRALPDQCRNSRPVAGSVLGWMHCCSMDTYLLDCCISTLCASFFFLREDALCASLLENVFHVTWASSILLRISYPK